MVLLTTPRPPTVWLLQVSPRFILRVFDLVTAYVLEAYPPLFKKKRNQFGFFPPCTQPPSVLLCCVLTH